MARFRRVFTRKMGPVGAVLTIIDIWRRIPPKHRRRIVTQTRKHGPRIVKAAEKHQPRRRRR